MTRAAEQVDSRCLDIDWHVPRRLGGIDQIEYLGARPESLANRFDWLNDTGHIRRVRHADQSCFGAEGGRDGLGCDLSQCIWRNIGRRYLMLGLPEMKRSQDRIVLQIGRDDMIPRTQCPMNCEIEAVRPSGSPDDAARVGGIPKLSQCRSGGVDTAINGLRHSRCAAARSRSVFGQILGNRSDNAIRLRKGRGCVIEIDSRGGQGDFLLDIA